MKIIKGITLTSEEMGEAFKEQMIERQTEPEKWKGLEFGHVELDDVTGGLRKGEYAVIAGAQKSGKTTIALSWAQHFSRQVQENELVLFVSLEMSHDSLAGRVLANLSDIEVTKFRDYELEGKDWDKLDRGVNKLSKLPILWNVGATTMDGIEALVDEYGDRIRVIVVDYFQLMRGSRTDVKRFEQLEEISLRLKHLTLHHDLSVLAISQQSRTSLRSLESQKDPNTLAGTQALARDCDLLVLVLPYIDGKEEVPHMRQLHIALARNSSAGGMLPAIFSGAYCRFGSPAKLELSEMPEQVNDYWNN